MNSFSSEKTLELYNLCHYLNNKDMGSAKLLLRVKRLVEEGADINWVNPKDHNRTAFIHRAFLLNKSKKYEEDQLLFNYFLEQGANPNYFCDFNYSAFWIMTNRIEKDTDLNFMIKGGANPYIKNQNQQIAFEYTDNLLAFLTLLNAFPPPSRRMFKTCTRAFDTFKDTKGAALHTAIQVHFDSLKIRFLLEKEIQSPNLELKKNKNKI